jgi:hypothetical protein
MKKARASRASEPSRPDRPEHPATPAVGPAEERLGMRRSRAARMAPAGLDGRVRRSCGPGCGCAACSRAEAGADGLEAGNGTGAGVSPPRAGRPPRVHPKLVLGAPDDPAERAADATADRVVRRLAAPDREPPGPAAATVRRQGADEGAGIAMPPDVEGEILGLHGGEPLPSTVRDRMEPAFGADFGHVRIHRNSRASETAEAIGARAYAIGDHVAFNRGAFVPGTAEGDRLIAHELAHVAESSPNRVRRNDGDEAPTIETDPTVSDADRFRSQLRVDIAEEIDPLVKSEECGTRVYGERASLLLIFGERALPGDETGVEAYREWLFGTAADEHDTLDALPAIALDAYPKAFPATWATLYGQLLDIDDEVVAEHLSDTVEAFTTLTSLTGELPAKLWQSGLPVPFEEARGMSRFLLSVSHAALATEGPVKEFAAAGLVYTRALWKFAFIRRWDSLAEAMQEAIRDCSMTPDVATYDRFSADFAGAFREIPERLRAASTEESLSEVEANALQMQEVIFAVGLVSGLEALVGILGGWSKAQDLFAAGMTGTDALVAAADDVDKFLKAISWADQHGYFGAAAEQIVNALLENGIEILAITLGLLAAGVAVQFVPVLNVTFDVALFIYGGIDLLRSIDSVATAVSAVFAATTTVGLQKASADLAVVLLADGATALLDVILFMVSLRGARGRAAEVKRQNPGITDEEALRRALGQSDDAASRALRRAGEYDAWEAGLNQETKALLRSDEGLRRLYQEMDPRVRNLLTRCASLCIVPGITRAQISRVVAVLERVGDSAIGRLKVYFHVNRNSIETAISNLERVRDLDGLDNLLTRSLAREANPATPPLLTEGAATALRNSPGAATGGTRLPRISQGEEWLRQTGGNSGLMPRQVAERLHGRTYENFSEMQSDFWREVANDPALSSGFNQRNLELMRGGQAPFAPEALQYGGASGGRYTLHHIRPIEHGGGVYDMDNLLVVSPRLHSGSIHAPTRRLPRYRQIPPDDIP